MERGVLYNFRTRGSGPRGAGTTMGPSGRQAAVGLKKSNPQARYPWVPPAGQPKTTRGSRWLDPRVTRISQVMIRPDPRDFKTS